MRRQVELADLRLRSHLRRLLAPPCSSLDRHMCPLAGRTIASRVRALSVMTGCALSPLPQKACLSTAEDLLRGTRLSRCRRQRPLGRTEHGSGRCRAPASTCRSRSRSTRSDEARRGRYARAVASLLTPDGDLTPPVVGDRVGRNRRRNAAHIDAHTGMNHHTATRRLTGR